jgi:4'-phosphopantetheinyl transferase
MINLPEFQTDKLIHILCVASSARFQSLLSSDELVRANKFRFQKDRNLYSTAHGFLRLLLGSYLKCEPGALEFGVNAYGKPFLMNRDIPNSIHFNLSHSCNYVAYAFNQTYEIGIDIEEMRPDFATQKIAEQFFSDHEVSVFKTLSESDRVEAFYNCWTRKEAFIKAVGEGLSYPLRDFDVSLKPGESAELLRIRTDAGEAFRWTLQDIPVAAGYKAAFAVRTKDLEVKIYDQEAIASILSGSSLTRSDL